MPLSTFLSPLLLNTTHNRTYTRDFTVWNACGVPLRFRVASTAGRALLAGAFGKLIIRPRRRRAGAGDDDEDDDGDSGSSSSSSETNNNAPTAVTVAPYGSIGLRASLQPSAVGECKSLVGR